MSIPIYPALLDIDVMGILSGLERTGTEWKTLLESVGLHILKIYKIENESEGLIEAVKAKT